VLDTKALAEATATIVREHISGLLAPVLERVTALENMQRVAPEKGDPGRDGIDGKDADLGEIRSIVEGIVAAALPVAVDVAVAALPIPEKGDPGEPGAPGHDGQNGEDGQPGRDGKDGVGLAGMMIDRAGEAIATLTDGTMIKLGPIVGRDGVDGAPGEPGKDGRDGKDLDDIHVTQSGSLVEFAFQIGETRSVYEVELPAGPPGENGKDAYPGEAKGLFDPNAEYRAMDVVSHNGSEWRAKHDNPGDLPGAGWMLSACKGKRGDVGKGQPGRDAAAPVAAYLKADNLIITLSDGQEIVADLSPLRTAD